MKKVITYLFFLSICFSVSGKNLDDIFAEFAKAPQAENVDLGKSVWSLMKLSNSGDKDNDIVKKISSIYVLNLNNCSEDIKLKFAKEIENMEMKGYEVLIKVKDDSDNVLILSKSKKDKIEEFVIISGSDPTIVRLKGNFKPEDFSNIAGKYGNKGN